MTDIKEKIKEFFEGRFMEWRAEQTSRKATIGQFAEWLGLTREALNSYMLRGSKPEGDNLDKVGKRYPEVYGLVGRTPPDPKFRVLSEIAVGLSEEGVQELINRGEEIREREQKGKGNEKTVQKPA